MLRLALVLGLAALIACSDSSPTPASAAPAEAAAAGLPAAPPASNAAPVVAAETARAPADTIEASRRETVETFEAILAEAEAYAIAERPYGEIVQWVGEQLLGRPYVAGMLDAPETETLVVDLTGFDCVLYVENVLAIARAVALGAPTYEAYAANVRDMRYRDGELGYCSRLHYFSDWIADNARRGTVENVTAAIGGERFDERLTFMTEHREAYPQMALDSTYACIVDMEVGLADVELFYVPQARIADVYPALRPGDVIATATSIGGLDVTHTGFVHQTDARTGFMHASLSSNAVKISDDLAAYVQGIRSQIGIVVARPLDPREPAAGG